MYNFQIIARVVVEIADVLELMPILIIDTYMIFKIFYLRLISFNANKYYLLSLYLKNLSIYK